MTYIPVSRQRVPMLDASMLEARTRPATETSSWTASRLRDPSRPAAVPLEGDAEVRTSSAPQAGPGRR